MSRARRKALSPSLFPFLAVLVCTLGTLILLLALVAQSATDAAERSAQEQQMAQQAKPTKTPDPRLTVKNVQSLVSQEQYRVEHLVSLREKQTADLEDRRDQVTHLEDHLRRLEDQLNRLNEEMRLALQESAIDQIGSDEIDRMKTEISMKQAEIEELKREGGDASHRIVIVPHKGPNGTDRRPVYLECTREGVTIWPEGSKVTHEELVNAQRGLVRSANPLDAALRTIRHHAMQHYGETTPPYPLLVVRPDGIESYAAARNAMQDWDEQFGYELVGQDVELAYKEPDSMLRNRVDLAIRAAVANQQPLALSASSIARGGSSGRRYPTLSAARLDRDGRANGFRSPSRSDRRSPNSFDNRSGYGGTSGYNNSQSGRRTPAGSSAYRSSPARNPHVPPAYTDARGSRGGAGGNPGLDRQTLEDMREAAAEMRSGADPSVVGDQAPTHQSGVPSFDVARPSPQTGKPVGSGYPADPSIASDPPFAYVENQSKQEGTASGSPSLQASSAQGSSAQGSSAQGSSAQDSSAQASSAQASSAQASSAQASSAQASSQSSSAQAATQSMQSASSSSAQMSPEQSTAAAAPQVNVDMNQPPSELLQRDGRNWALPRSLRGANGNAIVRTLHVECFKDRYVLLPSAGGGALEVFGISDSDADHATLKLATALHDRIARWGAALPGGRWQPQLNVVVKEGGEYRFGQLETLMQNSGIDVIGRSSK